MEGRIRFSTAGEYDAKSVAANTIHDVTKVGQRGVFTVFLALNNVYMP